MIHLIDNWPPAPGVNSPPIMAAALRRQPSHEVNHGSDTSRTVARLPAFLGSRVTADGFEARVSWFCRPRGFQPPSRS